VTNREALKPLLDALAKRGIKGDAAIAALSKHGDVVASYVAAVIEMKQSPALVHMLISGYSREALIDVLIARSAARRAAASQSLVKLSAQQQPDSDAALAADLKRSGYPAEHVDSVIAKRNVNRGRNL
jgi:hypothetical protein